MALTTRNKTAGVVRQKGGKIRPILMIFFNFNWQVDEWWEQPASTAVDWISVDGQNVAAWLAHVKQLQAAFYEKQLL